MKHSGNVIRSGKYNIFTPRHACNRSGIRVDPGFDISPFQGLEPKHGVWCAVQHPGQPHGMDPKGADIPRLGQLPNQITGPNHEHHPASVRISPAFACLIPKGHDSPLERKTSNVYHIQKLPLLCPGASSPLHPTHLSARTTQEPTRYSFSDPGTIRQNELSWTCRTPWFLRRRSRQGFLPPASCC